MTELSKKQSALTPLMRQFYEFKSKHPDKILFFRMGDFYEMFGDDAIKAAPILGITLTTRSHGPTEKIPLAGVPHHAAEKYLQKLIEAGEKVVIVEQVQDPKEAKGLVKRDIVEILTPGTATIESAGLFSKPPRLAALFHNGNGRSGMASFDISTGSFLVEEGDTDDVLERLKVIEPSELIFPRSFSESKQIDFKKIFNGICQLTPFEDFNFDFKIAERDLNQLLGTTTLEGFGITAEKLSVTAAGAILRYLQENHHNKIDHVNKISRFDNSQHMVLDFSTVRNLELLKNIATNSPENSLFQTINFCQSGSGARRLQNSLLNPFKSKTQIEKRLSATSELVKNRQMLKDIRVQGKTLPDLENLCGRLGLGKLNPRQAVSIKIALEISLFIKEIIKEAHSPHLMELGNIIPRSEKIIARISEALVDDPPFIINQGNIIKRGFSQALDDLNDSIKDARKYIGSLQQKERARTGINTLKVGFNKVFGYYIEMSRLNSASAPQEYIRKQTLVNAERYITPELKEKEQLILSAEEKIFKLESELYLKLVEELSSELASLVSLAHILAEIDLLSSFAELAIEGSYCRPEIFEDNRLVISEGRHPVIESVLPPGSYVPNDIEFKVDDRIHILTGPNMSGKSTYLRQTGLIVIMAQIGSFVPARSAEIGLVDRVFTRVGALDNLAHGQSTFLVEMVETANILNNATESSLVLLDEVGRGTSTFDGMSIAWAVVEYIEEHIKSRTIFATHYHELTGMAELSSLIKNYQVAVKKWEDKIIFMHQIIPGGCDDSYGIEVARLAGLPKKALNRSKQILRLLESGKFNKSELGKKIHSEKIQPSLFDIPTSEIEEKIKKLEIDAITPLEALHLLKDFKEDLT